jgi:hypothetical protein
MPFHSRTLYPHTTTASSDDGLSQFWQVMIVCGVVVCFASVCLCHFCASGDDSSSRLQGPLLLQDAQLPEEKPNNDKNDNNYVLHK